MKIIRVFYEPYRVFAGLEQTGFELLVPLIATAGFSLLAKVFLIVQVGSRTVVPSGIGVDPGGLTSQLVFYVLGTMALIVNLVLFSLLLYTVLRVVAGARGFRCVLSICAYAAYVREAGRFLVTAATILYADMSPNRIKIVTNATVFLNEASSGKPLYYFASFVDLPTILFLSFITIGLWKVKALPSFAIRNSIIVVLLVWMTFVGLGYPWRH
jgi:hypothetical protein